MTDGAAPKGLVGGFTGALVGAALSAPRLATFLRRHGAPAQVAETAAVVLVATGGWAALAALERRYPQRADWSAPKDDVATDATYFLLIAPAGGLAAKAVAGMVAPKVLRSLTRRLGRSPWPHGQPLAVRVGLAIVITELVHYWHHRWSHELPLLWRFHAVHHSAERLTWLNSARFHPVDSIPFIGLQDLAVLALGIDSDAFIGYSVLRGVHGQLQHANIEGSGGTLNTVFSTVDQHRWHHARPVDGRSHNYGAVLSIWDRVFGTQFLPADRAPFDEPIGLDDDRYGRRWPSQLAAPFRSSASGRGS